MSRFDLDDIAYLHRGAVQVERFGDLRVGHFAMTGQRLDDGQVVMVRGLGVVPSRGEGEGELVWADMEAVHDGTVSRVVPPTHVRRWWSPVPASRRPNRWKRERPTRWAEALKAAELAGWPVAFLHETTERARQHGEALGLYPSVSFVVVGVDAEPLRRLSERAIVVVPTNMRVGVAGASSFGSSEMLRQVLARGMAVVRDPDEDTRLNGRASRPHRPTAVVGDDP